MISLFGKDVNNDCGDIQVENRGLIYELCKSDVLPGPLDEDNYKTHYSSLNNSTKVEGCLSPLKRPADYEISSRGKRRN